MLVHGWNWESLRVKTFFMSTVKFLVLICCRTVIFIVQFGSDKGIVYPSVTKNFEENCFIMCEFTIHNCLHSCIY